MSGRVTMIDVLARLSIVALMAAQNPQSIEDLRALARDSSDSALVERARRRPGGTRGAIGRLMTAGHSDDSVGSASLDAAMRIAGAYATAWRDSFFVRRIARFRALPDTDRAASIAADSVLGAGTATLQRAGADSAMPVLREALRRFATLHDTTGMVVTIDNIGLALFYIDAVDSAETYFVQAFELAQQVGYYIMAGNAIGKMAIVSSKRGDVQQAKERYARAKPFRERAGDLGGLAADQHNLAVLALEHGDRSLARRSFNEALATLRSTGELADAAN